jgi:two-component system cell cycle response regulator DivK
MTAHAQKKEAIKGVRPDASPTVMVVEDYEEARHMISMVLRMSGYVVVEATNGQEAVELARRTRPNVILMDLHLPVLDGLAATRRIREQPETRDVPVVALTAHGTPDYRLKALAAGCNEFLTKPLDFDQLERTLKHLLPETASTGQ